MCFYWGTKMNEIRGIVIKVEDAERFRKLFDLCFFVSFYFVEVFVNKILKKLKDVIAL